MLFVIALFYYSRCVSSTDTVSLGGSGRGENGEPCCSRRQCVEDSPLPRIEQVHDPV